MSSLTLQVLFACSVFQGSYLVNRAFKPPNEDPSHVTKPDRLASPKYLVFMSTYGKFLGICGFLHGLLLLLPEETQMSLCPERQNLNETLFSWSTQSTSLIIVFLFGGYLRLLAYRQLDKNFTFGLARPSKLVQSGVYAYIQHPSYTGAILLLYGFSGLVVRPGGVFSCWTFSGSWVWTVVSSMCIYGNALYLVLAVVITFPMRISKEEEILRQGFGQEWETYHRATARFVPGII